MHRVETYTTSAGPAGDLRKAVIPNEFYVNFGILGNRLGKAWIQMWPLHHALICLCWPA